MELSQSPSVIVTSDNIDIIIDIIIVDSIPSMNFIFLFWISNLEWARKSKNLTALEMSVTLRYDQHIQKKFVFISIRKEFIKRDARKAV